MPRNASFWRNVTLIGAVHAGVVVGLVRWGGAAKKPLTSDIVWMDGSAGEAASLSANVVPPELTPAASATPVATDEQSDAQEPEEEAPVLQATESEMQLPTATPKPTSPTPAPRATASPKASPKATPKPTPKPAPKKTLVAKASPKPSAKKVSVKADLGNKDSTDTRKDSGAATTSNGTSGSGSRGTGAGSASQFGWYGDMLHDRFFSEWVQPKSAVMSGAKMSALVKIRIEKDGRVSDFAIVQSSGNVVVDESVAAVAKRVTQVDPLPAGLGSGGHYNVNINFELNPE